MSRKMFALACVFAFLAAIIVGTIMFQHELTLVRKQRAAAAAPTSAVPR